MNKNFETTTSPEASDAANVRRATLYASLGIIETTAFRNYNIPTDYSQRVNQAATAPVMEQNVQVETDAYDQEPSGAVA